MKRTWVVREGGAYLANVTAALRGKGLEGGAYTLAFEKAKRYAAYPKVAKDARVVGGKAEKVPAFVYVTARSVTGAIEAQSAYAAWAKVARLYKIEVLVSEKGEAYVPTTDGAPVREKDADWTLAKVKEALR